jgi:peptidoglycan LD-endopeptidase LytH
MLSLPDYSEAGPRHGKVASKRVLRRLPGGSRGIAPSRARATGNRRDPNLLSAGPVGSASSRSSARQGYDRLIYQTGSGEVILDSIQVVTAEGYEPAVSDATPAEAHNFPEPPCPAEDAPGIEAHVHAADDETPENADAGDVAPRHDSSRIARIARRLGSLFRPKSATARVRPHDVDLSELLAQNLLVPVEGVDRERLRDSFLDSRGQYARHLAIDIGAPRGTPILATDDGEIVKLTRERRGGITIYQKDSSGRYLFFYCHLSRYAQGMSVGQRVSKGDVIGYVGATGRVIGGPHLHFSITRLPDDDNLREGLAINPYLLFLAGVP